MTNAAEALERQLDAIRYLRRSITANYRPPGVSLDTHEEVLQTWELDVEILGRAKPMYWASETIESVVNIADTIDLVDVIAERELFYFDDAFCWFEKPWVSLAIESAVHDVRGLSWSYVANPQPDYGGEATGLMIAAYTVVEDHAIPMFHTGAGIGHPLDLAKRIRLMAGDTGDYGESGSLAADAVFRFAVSAGMFLRQKIAVAMPCALERHARKRALAAGYDSTVSVIALRKRESPRAEPSGAGQDWSCQWWVGGHVRQQYYPSMDKHLPILIAPYIKGPENMPLKPRATPIYLVNR